MCRCRAAAANPEAPQLEGTRNLVGHFKLLALALALKALALTGVTASSKWHLRTKDPLCP